MEIITLITIGGSRYPYFQVWRLLSTDSMDYINVGEVQLLSSQITRVGNSDHYNAHIVLTGNSTIKFQSGDVIGYFHGSSSYRVGTLRTSGYRQYEFDGSSTRTTVNLDNADRNRDQRQPLIQFVIGNKYCVILFVQV